MRRFRLPLAALFAAAVSSCVASPAVTTTPGAPGTAPTTLADAPTVAFPTVVPTATWTPGATLTPTADLRPGIGPLLLHDRMDEPSAWNLTTTAGGGAAITDGRLTLSVRTPRGYHTAFRAEPVVGDFYAEVDVYTEVCSPGDEVGLTARGNAQGEQYRFLMGCDGTARITRVLEEGSRALTLRVATPVILPGAPAHNHLAIWVRGLDLTFLVNDNEVLTVRDAALTRGAFGLIARAGSEGQVSAGFDDLMVHSLADPNATPIAEPPRTPQGRYAGEAEGTTAPTPPPS